MALPQGLTSIQRHSFEEVGGKPARRVLIVGGSGGGGGGVPTAQIITDTGNGAINFTTSIGSAFTLSSVSINLSAVPTTSEDIVIKLVSADGPTYDVELFRIDPTVKAVQDIYITFGSGYEFKAGDEIQVTYPNTDGLTYGLRLGYLQ